MSLILNNEIHDFNKNTDTRPYVIYNYESLSAGFAIEMLFKLKAVLYLLILSHEPRTIRSIINSRRVTLMLPFWFCYSVIVD